MKQSHGITCFRQHHGKWQIVLIKKRHTYNFASFVKGEYSNNNDAIKRLFDGMTIEEKQDIWFGDFDLLFGKLFGVMGNEIATPKFKARYEFMKSSYKKKFGNIPKHTVKSLLNGSKNVDTFWEIPKGSASYGEESMPCAKREFAEETGISGREIELISDEPVRALHSTRRMSYSMCFYPAILTKLVNRDNFINTMDFKKDYEVISCKWFYIDELSNININRYNVNCINSSFKCLQQFIYERSLQKSNGGHSCEKDKRSSNRFIDINSETASRRQYSIST